MKKRILLLLGFLIVNNFCTTNAIIEQSYDQDKKIKNQVQKVSKIIQYELKTRRKKTCFFINLTYTAYNIIRDVCLFLLVKHKKIVRLDQIVINRQSLLTEKKPFFYFLIGLGIILLLTTLYEFALRNDWFSFIDSYFSPKIAATTDELKELQKMLNGVLNEEELRGILLKLTNIERLEQQLDNFLINYRNSLQTKNIYDILDVIRSMANFENIQENSTDQIINIIIKNYEFFFTSVDFGTGIIVSILVNVLLTIFGLRLIATIPGNSQKGIIFCFLTFYFIVPNCIPIFLFLENLIRKNQHNNFMIDIKKDIEEPLVTE